MTDTPARAEPEAVTTEPAAPAPTSAWSHLWFFVELFAVSGLAFAQPAFDLLKNNSTDLLVGPGAQRSDVYLLMLIALFVPPIVGFVVVFVVGLARPAWLRTARAAMLGFFIGVFVFQALGSHYVSPIPLAAGLVCAVAATAAIRRWHIPSLYLRFLAVAPLVFALTFITSPSISAVGTTTKVSVQQPAASTTGSTATPARPKRIVEIVMDEFPTESLLDGSGAIDARLYPNFAALAGDSTWFRNTTAVAPYTAVAVPAIATGTYPADASAVPAAANYPRSIFRALAGSYDMNVHEAIEHLCPTDVCGATTAAQAFDLWSTVRGVKDLWYQRATRGPSQPEVCACGVTLSVQGPLVDQFVGSLRPAATSSKPYFDYMHVVLPHAPWRYLPTGQTYKEGFEVPSGLIAENTGWKDEAVAVGNRQRHLLQLAAADRYLGQIVTKLKAIDAYDDSLIVLTADHGVAFQAHEPYRVATASNYAQVGFVPLFVKLPGAARGAGAVTDRPARTVDVFPTILDAVGLDPGWQFDGASLLAPPTAESATEAGFKFLDWPAEDTLTAPPVTKYHTYDRREGFAQILADRALPAGATSAVGVYSVGEYPQLVGTNVSDHPVATLPGKELAVILVNAKDYTNLDPSASFLPAALVRGGMGDTAKHVVAIAVNGRIAGVGPTKYNLAGKSAFEIMLDPSAFRGGANNVQAYVVVGSPDHPELAPVRRFG